MHFSSIIAIGPNVEWIIVKQKLSYKVCGQNKREFVMEAKEECLKQCLSSLILLKDKVSYKLKSYPLDLTYRSH